MTMYRAAVTESERSLELVSRAERTPFGKIAIDIGVQMEKWKRAYASDDPEFNLVVVGRAMEQVNGMLQRANDEVDRSRKELEKAAMAIHAITKDVLPELTKTLAAVRDSRMAVVNEMKDMLTVLRDVRRFFIEDEFDLEQTRMERFIVLCREFQSLKKDGVLDAVCDSALRLATERAP